MIRLSRNFKDIEMLEFNRKIDTDTSVVAVLNLEHNLVTRMYTDEQGDILDSYGQITKEVTQDEVNDFLEKLEPFDILNWPYFTGVEWQENIPLAAYYIDDEKYLTVKNPQNSNHMRQIHAMFEDLLGAEIGDASDYSDFDLVLDYRQLRFLEFVAKNLDESETTANIFPKSNNLWLNFTRSNQPDKPNVNKDIRRSSMRKFIETVKELDLYNWPVKLENKPSFIHNFPYIEYSIDNSLFVVQADAIPAEKLIALHKALERLSNETFGSYSWYK